MNKKLLLSCVFLYCLLFCFLFNAYYFVFDVDAIGYISVAKRVVAGDWYNSINGCWSPLNSWLIIPFIKSGIAPEIAAKYCNGLFGACSIVCLFYLIKKFDIHPYFAKGIMFASIVIFLHFAFCQLFGDLLQILILLIYLNVICSENFINNYRKIILSGIICGIGYYSKYYTFYFAFLHIILVITVLIQREYGRIHIREVFVKSALAIGSMIIVILPWAVALSQKYGYFTIANTGRINQAWFLSPAYPQSRELVFAPPYPNASSLFEDPSFWNGVYVHPFINKTVFLYQLKLIITNIKNYIQELNDFSFVAVAVIIIACFFAFFRNKLFAKNPNNCLLLLAILIMPIGYILIYIEHRYVWLAYLGALIIAGVVLTILHQKGLLIGRKVLLPVAIIVFGSFCLYPANKLQDQAGEGKEQYIMADALKKNNVKGNFIANGGVADYCMLQAYLTGSRFFLTQANDYSEKEILQIINQYKIDYYFMYYKSTEEKDGIVASAIAKDAKAILPDIYAGLIILSFK